MPLYLLLSLALVTSRLLNVVVIPQEDGPSCAFALGFAAMHDLIPDVVGDCLDDETYDPTTGDGHQPTTNGMLLWRKADSVVSFSDGTYAVLDGPLGLQQRPDGCRFNWEPNPTALPLVGTTACAPATPPVVFGVNFHPLHAADAPALPAAEALDRATAVGASAVRIDIHWAWIEPAGPGQALWTSYLVQQLDSFLDAANQRHLQVLAVVTESPCWALPAYGADCSEKAREDLPADANDFANFLGQLVSRYHDQIHYWELWNEPNLAPDPDPAAYARLLQTAYPVVKALDPSAVVLAGALAPVEAGPYSTQAYVAGMYAAGAKGFFDGLSFHPYTDGHAPTWYDDQFAMHSFTRSVQALHDQMLAAGDTSPLWLTEGGWTTVSRCVADVSKCSVPTLPTTEAAQRVDLTESLLLLSRWNFVAGYFWYELADDGPLASDNVEDHYGLFHHDLSPKPAALWLEHVVASR